MTKYFFWLDGGTTGLTEGTAGTEVLERDCSVPDVWTSASTDGKMGVGAEPVAASASVSVGAAVPRSELVQEPEPAT